MCDSKLMTKYACHTELNLCGIFFTSAQFLNKLMEESCIQTAEEFKQGVGLKSKLKNHD